LARFGRAKPQLAHRATATEAFRVLRANLLVAIAELDNPIVVVTSAYAREGKTSTCVNLAQSLAAAGPRVVLVDLDLRHPDSHHLLDAHNEVGVSDVLLDRAKLEDCLQYVELASEESGRTVGLYFLATGPQVANPTELLATPRTGRLLESLAAQADIVLLDTPPVLPVADTLVIGRLAAGAVLVVEARRTPVPSAQRAKDMLTRNQTRLLGVVLNKFQPKFAGSSYGEGETFGYGYGYGYGYGSRAPDGAGGNGARD
jgi:capsular exopolysaccharide synthesis family protein